VGVARPPDEIATPEEGVRVQVDDRQAAMELHGTGRRAVWAAMKDPVLAPLDKPGQGDAPDDPGPGEG
jgi:hypothetical protein